MFESSAAPDDELAAMSPESGVMIKLPSDGPARAREGELLRRVRLPGVVELIDAVVANGETTLHLAAVPGGRSLDECPPLKLGLLIDVAQQVARTISHLHDADASHQAIRADHVIVDPQNRAVLCGFGNWTPLVDAGESTDIVAVGEMILAELDRSASSGTIDADHPTAGSLRHLCARAADYEHTPLSARVLADRLDLLAVDPDDARSRRAMLTDTIGSLGRIGAGLAVGAAVVTVGVFAWMVLGPSTDPAEVVAPTTSIPVAPPDTAAAGPTSGPGLIAATADPCPPPPESATVDDTTQWADIDGDRCLEPWWFADGVLTVSSERYNVGSTDDLVAFGDWDCDGTSTPAVVQASSGVVQFFASFATSTADASAHPMAGPAEPAQIAVEPIGLCDVLIVTDAAGVSTTVALEEVPS
jgi:hypothetical protein